MVLFLKIRHLFYVVPGMNYLLYMNQIIVSLRKIGRSNWLLFLDKIDFNLFLIDFYLIINILYYKHRAQNEGTCFLFQCGPAQNFRCKFTHHANYTSAVLAPPIRKIEPPPPAPPAQPVAQQSADGQQQRHQSAAAGQSVLSQHEMELSSLKETPSKG